MIDALKNWPVGKPVPAISLRQPWPTAVLFYGKDVENRSNWPFKYRGPLLIHASKSKPIAEQIEWMVNAAKKDGVAEEDLEMFGDGCYPLNLPFGCIVAAANLKDVFGPEADVPEDHPVNESPWTDDESNDWLYLDQVVPVTPVPFKGAVGMFYVPYDVAVTLNEPSDAATAYFSARQP
jgi:hypothetical protein